MLKEKQLIVSDGGLSSEEETLISAFVQETVYVWCKQPPKVWFARRDLMGLWKKATIRLTETCTVTIPFERSVVETVGESLQPKLRNYLRKNFLSIKHPAINAGKSLKSVINSHNYRLFDTKGEDKTRKNMGIGR